MQRSELRDGLHVLVNWPNDDAQTATVRKCGNRLELHIHAGAELATTIQPQINDKLLSILEPLAREDFFWRVDTLDESVSVGVSQGDYDWGSDSDRSCCLLQVGEDGNFTCVHLNDSQRLKLIEALTAFGEAAN